MTWTDERVALLKQLWAEGWSGSEIAEKLRRNTGMEVTRNAVIGKVHRLRLSGRAKPTRRAVSRRPANGYSPRSHSDYLKLKKAVLEAASKSLTSTQCVELLQNNYGIRRSTSAVNKAARKLGVRLVRLGLPVQVWTRAQAARQREQSAARARRRREEMLAKYGDEPAPIGTKDPRGCRWIHGHPSDADWRFCSHPVEEGTSWCGHHLMRVRCAPDAAA